MTSKKITGPQSDSVLNVTESDGHSQRVAIGTREVKQSNPVPNPDTFKHEGYLQGFRLYLVVLAISIGYFLILLNSTVVVTAIPTITNRFHSAQDVGWYGSAYLLSNCALQPLSGKIYTFYSIKTTFLSFLAVFELGSLICGVSSTSTMFIVGRAIAGSGASGLLNGGITIVHSSVPQRNRQYVIAFAMAFGACGQVLGPLLGGVLTQYATWRWSFYINLPLGGATGLLILLIRIPEQRLKKRSSSLKATMMQLDPLGFLLFAPSVIMLLLALNWGNSEYSWASATVIGLLCGSFCSACVFLYWEWRQGESAMVPLYLFKNRIIGSCCLTGLLQAGAINEMTYFLPIWFQAIRGDTPTISGVDIMPTVVSQILSAAITGVLVGKIGYPLPFAELGSICLSVGAGLLSTLTYTSSPRQWIGYQILAGAGRGIVEQLPVGVVQAVLTGEDVAAGSSILVFTQYLGCAIFISAADALFTNRLKTSLEDLGHGYNASDSLLAGTFETGNGTTKANETQLISAYNDAITQTFYLAAGAGAATVFTSLGMGLINVKKSRIAAAQR